MHYHLFGLEIASELELPELDEPLPASRSPEPQVVINLGKVAESLDGGRRINKYYEFSKTSCLVNVEHVARFEASEGESVVIEPCQTASEDDIRTFLFGTVFSLLLHQRKLLPLHIGAVASPKGTIAFTGVSGAGKSTLAGLLHKRSGWPLISDDLAVVNFHDGAPTLQGGMLRLKLWSETIARLAIPATRTTQDATRHDKYHLISPTMFTTEAKPLIALLVLGQAERPALDRLEGGDAFAAVMNTIYRPEFARVYNDTQSIIKSCVKLANTIGVYSFDRPWDVSALDAGADFIIEHFLGEGARQS